MDEQTAVLKRLWTSLQGQSFTVISTVSLFSSIEASSVFIILLRTKMPKYLLNNLCVTQTANTEIFCIKLNVNGHIREAHHKHES